MFTVFCWTRIFVLEEESQNKVVELPTACRKRLLKGVGKSLKVTEIHRGGCAAKGQTACLTDKPWADGEGPCKVWDQVGYKTLIFLLPIHFQVL